MSYLAHQDLLKQKNIKKIFFYRICGTGMGAAACLLKEAGFEVEGMDSNFFPPMSDYLASTGIPCHTEVSDDFIRQFDLIVVGNVIPKGSSDAKRIESLGVSYTSFPAAIGALILNKCNVVGIAGTHGKTTTTYFAVQMFRNLGFDPGYFIGGVLHEGPSSSLGVSLKDQKNFFFIESDEYDSAYFEKQAKFLNYSLNHAIVTSLEFDHADIYESLDQIVLEFKKILDELPGTGVLNTDYEALLPWSDKFLSYGMKSQAGPANLQIKDGQTTFDLSLGGEKHSFKTNLVGEHNILNISSLLLFAHAQGIEVDKLKKSILNLKMVKRRQEERGYFGECLVIDDFAHHPKAVKLTLEGIKAKYPGKSVVTLFEPHSATARSALFQEEFSQALSSSDQLLITRLPRATSVKGSSDLNIEEMILRFKSESAREAKKIESLEELLKELEILKTRPSILLVLSNGTCLGLWQSDFVEKLKK